MIQARIHMSIQSSRDTLNAIHKVYPDLNVIVLATEAERASITEDLMEAHAHSEIYNMYGSATARPTFRGVEYPPKPEIVADIIIGLPNGRLGWGHIMDAYLTKSWWFIGSDGKTTILNPDSSKTSDWLKHIYDCVETNVPGGQDYLIELSHGLGSLMPAPMYFEKITQKIQVSYQVIDCWRSRIDY